MKQRWSLRDPADYAYQIGALLAALLVVLTAIV
jgi:hypothetical protein